MTLLCVPLFVETPEQALLHAREARDRGADIVEFRLDSYYTGHDDPAQIPPIVKLISACPLPCIATCRPVLEGGQYDGPDDARISLMERLGTAGGAGKNERPPTYIDVELATYTRSANLKQKVNLAVDHEGQQREVSTSLILSSHNFHTRPDDLARQIAAMNEQPAARVIKIAYRARSLRDNLELLDIIAMIDKPTIALGMGPFGLMSRVLAPKFNGFLTFATLRRDEATAPGQPIISELVETYRFRSITSTTKVYGVIGWPVEHSLSPLIHNAGFEAAAFDGVYLPMPVAPDSTALKATLLELIEHVNLDFAGCSVTIPHKENLVRLAHERQRDGDDRWKLDPLCERCGAANTVVVKRDPKGRAATISLHNTDGPAAAALLRNVSPKRVALLGTGGTSRAIAAALLDQGLEVIVVSREERRAKLLLEDLDHPSLSHAPATDLPKLRPGAVVNCTPLGMAGGPAPDKPALPTEILRNLPPTCVVMDCVYYPLRTPLLKEAETAGFTTIDGLALLVGQASAQYELWTGRPAPARLFERISRETLESRNPSAP